METLSIETPTHGRVLVKRPTVDARIAVVAFHGYAQSADDLMAELDAIPGSDAWTRLSVQALHRFYTRGDQKIVASWMTREDREVAIADNIAYVDRVVAAVAIPDSSRLFFLGFSQGAAMAYRAALRGQRSAAGIIAIGGDVPPDVKSVSAERWPRTFIAAGQTDHWFTSDKVAADETCLQAHRAEYEILRHDAGHVFTDDVRAAIAAFVTRS